MQELCNENWQKQLGQTRPAKSRHKVRVLLVFPGVVAVRVRVLTKKGCLTPLVTPAK